MLFRSKKGNASTAEWIPEIPSTGQYAVYVSYQTLPNSADELADEARRHGFTTMRERCRDLVLRGETTAEEAARTISSTIES